MQKPIHTVGIWQCLVFPINHSPSQAKYVSTVQRLPGFSRFVIYPSYFTLNYLADRTNEMWPIAGANEGKIP